MYLEKRYQVCLWLATDVIRKLSPCGGMIFYKR